jgi:DNA-binding NarL/FixJ family response regulator
MQAPIIVAVAAGDRLFCEALAAMLANHGDLRMVELHDHGRETPKEDGAPAVDIVLVDAEAALARACEICERWRGAKMIVLGLDREDDRLIDFIEMGVLGYVLNGTSPQGLADRIREVHQGRTLCSPRVVTSVVERISQLSRVERRPSPHSVEPLTPRETEILALMARGLGNKEIGRSLRVTVQTVKNHVHNLLAKLGVHRRREAVRLGFELGLLAESQEGGLDLF